MKPKAKFQSSGEIESAHEFEVLGDEGELRKE